MHEFGNGASIFTRDGDTAREFARQCRREWSGSMFPSLSRWPFIALVGGSARSSAIMRCMGRRASGSIRGSRPLLRGGLREFEPVSSTTMPTLG